MRILSYNNDEDLFFVGLRKEEFEQIKEFYSSCLNTNKKSVLKIKQCDLIASNMYQEKDKTEHENYINIVKNVYKMDEMPFICVIVDRNVDHIETTQHHLPFSHMWAYYSPWEIIEGIDIKTLDEIKNIDIKIPIRILVKKGDITTAYTDAIVNAANSSLLGGSGVCGSIFKAAGWDNLQNECNKIGKCEVGEAVSTSACNLRFKRIIHAVGPIYENDEKSEPLLKSAYYNSLKEAEKHGCKTIAFPAISTGIYGYPLEKATKIVKDVMSNYRGHISECQLYCFDNKTYEIYKKMFNIK